MDTNKYADVHIDGSALVYRWGDPDITFDKDGYAYIHVNGNKYRYPYADTITISDEDTGRAGHAAKDGAKRAGDRRVDPDHNGDK
jgi:hypothetical protein